MTAQGSRLADVCNACPLEEVRARNGLGMKAEKPLRFENECSCLSVFFPFSFFFCFFVLFEQKTRDCYRTSSHASF